MITDLEHVLVYVGLAVVALFLVVVAVVAVRFSTETSKALRQWADRNAWTFTRKEPNLAERWPEHPIRGAGAAVNVVRGTVPEGDITCFTHEVTSAGSSMTITRVVGVINVGVALPKMVAASTRPMQQRPPLLPVFSLLRSDNGWLTRPPASNAGSRSFATSSA